MTLENAQTIIEGPIFPRQADRISVSMGYRNALKVAGNNLAQGPVSAQSIFVAGHIHTVASGEMSNQVPFLKEWGVRFFDCNTPLASVVDYAAGHGIQAFMITEHDNQEIDHVWDYIETRQDEFKPVAVPGVELSFNKWHLLMLGYRFPGGQAEIDSIRRNFAKVDWRDEEFQAFCYEYRQRGAYIAPAHPYDPFFDRVADKHHLWPHMNGLEVVNTGSLSNVGFKDLAMRLAGMGLNIEQALLLLTGTDAHRLNKMDTLMQIHAPVDGNIVPDQAQSSRRIMELLAGGLADGTPTAAMNERVTMHLPKTPALLRFMLNQLNTVFTQFEVNKRFDVLKLIAPAIGMAFRPSYRDGLLDKYRNHFQ